MLLGALSRTPRNLCETQMFFYVRSSPPRKPTKYLYPTGYLFPTTPLSLFNAVETGPVYNTGPVSTALLLLLLLLLFLLLLKTLNSAFSAHAIQTLLFSAAFSQKVQNPKHLSRKVAPSKLDHLLVQCRPVSYTHLTLPTILRV